LNVVGWYDEYKYDIDFFTNILEIS
jgi:hypothetical protein